VRQIEVETEGCSILELEAFPDTIGGAFVSLVPRLRCSTFLRVDVAPTAETADGGGGVLRRAAKIPLVESLLLAWARRASGLGRVGDRPFAIA
jgi:hypothetical protein